jgi:pseudouridine kinase
MADVVVVGACNLDIKAQTLSRHVPGTSNPGVVSHTSGGVGRNIAHNLARLGASVALVSAVGRDAAGETVLAATHVAGVDVSRVERSADATGTYVAVLDHDGELVTALNDMRSVEAITPQVISRHRELLNDAKLIVADCNLPQDALHALVRLVGHKLVVEPVSVPKAAKLAEALKTGTIFLASPNRDQIARLTGETNATAALAELHRMGLHKAVLHAGRDGAYVSEGQGVHHVPAQPPAVIRDVTGAGDAAVAGLVFGLLQGESLLEAAARGQALAGQVIGSTASTLEVQE